MAPPTGLEPVIESIFSPSAELMHGLMPVPYTKARTLLAVPSKTADRIRRKCPINFRSDFDFVRLGRIEPPKNAQKALRWGKIARGLIPWQKNLPIVLRIVQ
jgi:hypothetical protein